MDINFLPVPRDAVDELAEVGAQLFPDVPKDNIHRNYPKDIEIPLLPSNPEESFKDEDEAAPVF